MDVSHDCKLIASTNVREYFHGAVTSAMANQKVEAEQDTVGYVVDLLTQYTRSDRFFEQTADGPTLQPLAMVYAEAVSATSDQVRCQYLRRLGDVALFISGAFSESLNRKLVDVDYYVAMGGSAYDCLSQSRTRVKVLNQVFAELAAKFQDFVDVLGEITERTHLQSGTDVLRLYELWLRTGSRRAAEKLRGLGIHPAESMVSRASH